MAKFGDKVKKQIFGKHRFGETKDYTRDPNKPTPNYKHDTKPVTAWKSP